MGISIEGADIKVPKGGAGVTILILSFCCQELYYLSPLYFIFKYKKKCIEMKNLPLFQIFSNTLNCLFFITAVLKKAGDFENLITNTFGFVFCLIVVYQLFHSLTKFKEKLSGHFFYLFIIYNLCFQFFYYISGMTSQIISKILNVSMYFFCNQNDYYAFKEKKSGIIPILSCVLGLSSSIGWIIYNTLVLYDNPTNEDITWKNLYTNIVGCLFLVFPILEYTYIRMKYELIKEIVKKDDDDDGDDENNEDNKNCNEKGQQMVDMNIY